MTSKAAESLHTTPKVLVLVLHAWNQPIHKLSQVCDLIREKIPGCKLEVPRLPLGFWSFADLTDVSRSIANRIDELDKAAGYDDIIIVGHSAGATLARTIYLTALGVNLNGSGHRLEKPLPWAAKLSRVVQFAAFNRGWQVSYLAQRFAALAYGFGRLATLALKPIFGSHVGVQLYRGSVFINQMRLHWIEREYHHTTKGLPWPLVVQLLGSRDDLIAPEDAVDMATARNFCYLDMPFSDHYNVIDLKPQERVSQHECEAAAGRSEMLTLALTEDVQKLRDRSELTAPEPVNTEVTHVVFVIHGIRDPGFWAQHIARTVLDRADAKGKRKETRVFHPSYGYFGMGPFLARGNRLAKVAWFMEHYLAARSQFPKAEISYIGHSNGTYLPTCALELYPACLFRHLALAGSVARSRFPWPRFLRLDDAANSRVQKVCNYVATEDLVVAGFPNVFEYVRVQDLGAAGHRGFVYAPEGHVTNYRYAPGGHSAALAEEFWKSLGDFIITGNPPSDTHDLRAPEQSGLAKFIGQWPIVAWAVAICIALILGAVFVGIGLGAASLLNLPAWRGFFLGVSVTAFFWAFGAILRRV